MTRHSRWCNYSVKINKAWDGKLSTGCGWLWVLKKYSKPFSSFKKIFGFILCQLINFFGYKNDLSNALEISISFEKSVVQVHNRYCTFTYVHTPNMKWILRVLKAQR